MDFIVLDVVAERRNADPLEGQHFGNIDVDAQILDNLTRIDVDEVLVDAVATDQQLFVRQIERHFGSRLDVDGDGELISVSSAGNLSRCLALANGLIVFGLGLLFFFD